MIFSQNLDSLLLYWLQVKQDGFFPADLLFLASTNMDGVCYIEVFTLLFLNSLFSLKFVWRTGNKLGNFCLCIFPSNFLLHITPLLCFVCLQTANLDGETNLKIRKALEKTWDYLTPEKISEFKGCSLIVIHIYLSFLYIGVSNKLLILLMIFCWQ